MTDANLWVWVVFVAVVLGAITFDLGVTRGTRGDLSVRAATIRSAAWIGPALLLGVGIAVLYGRGAARTSLTAYLLEQSLSVDNLFVFVLSISELRLPT